MDAAKAVLRERIMCLKAFTSKKSIHSSCGILISVLPCTALGSSSAKLWEKNTLNFNLKKLEKEQNNHHPVPRRIVGLINIKAGDFQFIENVSYSGKSHTA